MVKTPNKPDVSAAENLTISDVYANKYRFYNTDSGKLKKMRDVLDVELRKLKRRNDNSSDAFFFGEVTLIAVAAAMACVPVTALFSIIPAFLAIAALIVNSAYNQNLQAQISDCQSALYQIDVITETRLHDLLQVTTQKLLTELSKSPALASQQSQLAIEKSDENSAKRKHHHAHHHSPASQPASNDDEIIHHHRRHGAK